MATDDPLVLLPGGPGGGPLPGFIGRLRRWVPPQPHPRRLWPPRHGLFRSRDVPRAQRDRLRHRRAGPDHGAGGAAPARGLSRLPRQAPPPRHRPGRLQQHYRRPRPQGSPGGPRLGAVEHYERVLQRPIRPSGHAHRPDGGPERRPRQRPRPCHHRSAQAGRPVLRPSPRSRLPGLRCRAVLPRGFPRPGAGLLPGLCVAPERAVQPVDVAHAPAAGHSYGIGTRPSHALANSHVRPHVEHTVHARQQSSPKNRAEGGTFRHFPAIRSQLPMRLDPPHLPSYAFAFGKESHVCHQLSRRTRSRIRSTSDFSSVSTSSNGG